MTLDSMIIVENEEVMKKSRIILGILFVLGGVLLLFFSFEEKEIILRQEENLIESEEGKMEKNLSLQVNGKTFKITLEPNETSQSLRKILPLKITMEELNRNEKYHYLESMLPSNPIRVEKIESGDIMLYGDNCLVLFYEDFTTSYSYTRIGKIENTEGLKEALGSGNVEMEIN